MESATYIEEELQNELLFEYMYLFDLMFDENYLEDRQINDVLLIGGGAFIEFGEDHIHFLIKKSQKEI